MSDRDMWLMNASKINWLGFLWWARWSAKSFQRAPSRPTRSQLDVHRAPSAPSRTSAEICCPQAAKEKLSILLGSSRRNVSSLMCCEFLHPDPAIRLSLSEAMEMSVQARGLCPSFFKFHFQSFEDRPVGITVEFDDAGDRRHRPLDVVI